MTRLPHKVALLFALALAPACIIGAPSTTATTGSSDTSEFVCDDPNSYLDGETCYCNPGYEYCTADPDDLSCCPVEDATTTVAPGTTGTTDGPLPTTDGTTTSLPPTSTTTETTGTTTETGTTDETGTTGPEECMGAQPPPEECQNGQFWCTMPEACGPGGSEVYRCENGAWGLEPNLAKDSCNFDGYDFAYGCVDSGKDVEFWCGDGPGTACEDADPTSCAGDTELAQCIYGKLTHFDCFVQCTEVGDDMGALYDHGFCGDDRGTSVCLCCDMGDPGCPI